MIVSFVLAFSILLQFSAAGIALSLIKVTERTPAWIIIATAITMMGVRRSISLYKVVTGQATADLTAETLAMCISAGLLIGLFFIRRLFRDLKLSGISYKNMLDTTVDTFYSTDSQGKILIMSKSVEQELGYRQEDLIGKNMADLYVNKNDRARFIQELLEGEGEVHGIQTYLWHKNGNKILVESNARLTLSTSGEVTGVQGIARNISGRIEREDLNTKLGKIVESAANEIYVFNSKNHLLSLANKRARSNLGFDMEALKKLKMEDICPEFLQANILRKVKNLELNPEIVIDFEATNIRSDQSQYPVEVHLQYVDSGIEPVFFAIVIDLTSKQHIQSELNRSRRLQSIGQLTGGISHDFNNMLQILQLNIEAIEPIENHLERYRNDALKVVDRASQLTHRLLAFSRGQSLVPTLSSVNQIVENTAVLLDRSLGKSIHMKLELSSDLPPILIDEGELENAILNLALNARDAMPTGGSLTIGSKAIILDQGQSDALLMDPGNYVVIDVSDTGEGISAEVLDRVYEPFFTTKKVGAGTGLGLSMIYGFIKQSGGNIVISSEPGRGTRVLLYFKEAPKMQG